MAVAEPQGKDISGQGFLALEGQEHAHSAGPGRGGRGRQLRVGEQTFRTYGMISPDQSRGRTMYLKPSITPPRAELILLALVMGLASGAHAADETALSCSAELIQAAIDACVATGGGTVTLPPCNAESLWSAADRISKDVGATELRVVGQGTASTRIGYADDQSANTMWSFSGEGFKELAHIYLEGNPTIGDSAVRTAFVIHGARDCRVHHLETKNFRGPTATLCGSQNLVIDHCQFGSVLYDTTYHFYVYDRADEPWSDDWPGAFGSASYNVFFEDNTLGGAHHPVSLFERAKVVFRHNTVTIPPSAYGPSGSYQGNLDSHSPGYGSCSDDGIPDASSYEHGGQAYEIYGNTFSRADVTPPDYAGYAVRLRSGAAIIANNQIEGFNTGVSLVLENNNIGGLCDSAHGFPQDHAFGPDTGCTPGDGCCDRVEHMYVWGNTFTNVKNETKLEGQAGGLTEGVDYFWRAPSQHQDGFEWNPYPYPHPLVAGTAAPDGGAPGPDGAAARDGTRSDTAVADGAAAAHDGGGDSAASGDRSRRTGEDGCCGIAPLRTEDALGPALLLFLLIILRARDRKSPR